MRHLNPPFYQPYLYAVIKNLCYLIAKLFWRLKVSGSHHFPTTGAVIIAANHRSLADPPVVGVSTKRMVHFLAKEELFRFRPFGWLILNLNAHPLKRSTGDVAAFKMARHVLSQGEALILFPEGRRSKTGDLGPGKAGVGMLAALAKCPVIPTYIHNTGELKRFKPLKVVFGPPLTFSEEESYQGFSDKVMKQIAQLKSDVTRTEAI